MQRSKRLVTVGFRESESLSELAGIFAARGFQLQEASARELPALLRKGNPAAILVYHTPAIDAAGNVLGIVALAGRRTPVIVVVERAEPGEYYELMCRGAFDYFELANGPEPIERSLQAAAGSRAA